MKEAKSSLLISIDFRANKGGISRVAHLMAGSIKFDMILSLYGNHHTVPVSKSNIRFFNGNKILFSIALLKIVFLKKPSFIIFDHLNIARILSIIPAAFFKEAAVFLHDEEAWCTVSGLRKKALDKCFRLLCNSEYTRKRFLSSNPRYQSKTRTCLLAGVPAAFTENIKPDHQLDLWLNQERPFLLFVSRLWKVHRYKGYMELLEAFRIHYEHSKNASMRLALIGNGDDEPAVRTFISDHGLQDHIHLFTNVSDGNLKKFYKASDALLFPSTREGFGLVFLEAMFFGKCCIGIVNQPAEEIIVQNKTGILLPDNQPKSLMRVIEDMEADPAKYRQMGEEGHKHYMNNFRNDHFKKRFFEALNS
jgi:glycosyltransferase involved in cell wall biosynthesis